MQINTALDTAIAIVVILLVLSLIVQATQTAFKKLFKIKSRQIEASLVDLFETVLNEPPAKLTGRLASIRAASPVLAALLGRPKKAEKPADGANAEPSPPSADGGPAPPKAEAITAAVIDRFKKMGRVAQSGKPMLDSLSKDELLKVMGNLAPGSLDDKVIKELGNALDAYKTLAAALDEVKSLAANLTGDSSATLARMQQLLTPLLNDLGALSNGGAGRVIGDLLALREVDLDEVLKLLGELQSKVEADLSKAPDSSKQGLTDLAAALNKVAAALSGLRQKLDAAITPIKEKLAQVETWFDTVMLSFEERYSRGMKTWAVVIGFLIVILLNADFFKICHTLSTNEVVRNQIVSYGEELQKKKEDAKKTGEEVKENAEKMKTAESQGKADEAANLKKQVDNGAQKADDLSKTIKDLKDTYDAETARYTSFGLDRLHWADVQQWWHGWSTDDIADKVKRDVMGLVGWLITALLLSVGAPFWQDTLESLFGVKNLLRKKSGKNGGDDGSPTTGEKQG